MQRLVPILLLTGACASDPQYVFPPAGIEVGVGDDMGVATATMTLPFDNAKLTGMDYQLARVEALTELNARVEPDVTDDQFPLVRLDQVHLSVEWTIRNLSDQPATARIKLDGGNQYWYYVPANFIVDPDDEEEPEPPSLAGDVPIQVPPQGEVSGVFREDTVREAGLDLDLITRATINPFAAILNIHEDIKNANEVDAPTYPPPEDGVEPAPVPSLPIEAFGAMVRFDLTVEADQHMVLEYAVRVRDPEGLLHEELESAPPEELYPFMPAEYVPPAIVP